MEPLPGSADETGTGARQKRGKTEPGGSGLPDHDDDDEPVTLLSGAITNKKQKTASDDHRNQPVGLCSEPVPIACMRQNAHVSFEAGDSPDSSCPDDDDDEDDAEVDHFHSHSDQLSDGHMCEEGDEVDDFSKPADLTQWLSMFQQWTNTERLSALEALVTNNNCDGQQIRFLLSLIEPQLQRDFVSLLPKELALYVLSFLDPKDLLQAAQTCRYWRILCEDNLLWREKCREEGLLQDQETITDLFRKRSAKSRCKSLQTHSASGSSATCAAGDATVPPVSSEYKLGFLRQKSIEYNWRYGRFPADPDAGGTNPPTGRKGRYLRAIQQLKGHDDHVITCLQFNPTSK
jgi:hypothetical protein